MAVAGRDLDAEVDLAAIRCCGASSCCFLTVANASADARLPAGDDAGAGNSARTLGYEPVLRALIYDECEMPTSSHRSLENIGCGA